MDERKKKARPDGDASGRAEEPGAACRQATNSYIAFYIHEGGRVK